MNVEHRRMEVRLYLAFDYFPSASCSAVELLLDGRMYMEYSRLR